MKNLYLNGLSGLTEEQVIEEISKEFEISSKELDGFTIVIGEIDSYCYEEEAYFVLRENNTGLYYEVIASHCSYSGFEEQWNPVPTTKEYLLSEFYSMRHKPEIVNFLKEILD